MIAASVSDNPICPVCGYPHLSSESWSNRSPSHEICVQCGTQFGLHDDVGFKHPEQLADRHATLGTAWRAAGSQWHSKRPPPEGYRLPAPLKGVPAHLQIDGPFADSMPKGRTVTKEVLETYWLFEQLCERPLSTGHISSLEAWMQQRSESEFGTSDTRMFEARMYLRQVAARALIDRDTGQLPALVNAALVMGAGATGPREQSWRLLRYPWQVAMTLTGSPQSALLEAVAETGQSSVAAVEARLDNLARMVPLPLVHHQPGAMPLLEPLWDPAFNAERLAMNSRRLDDPKIPQPKWSIPEPGYLDQLPAGSSGDGDDARTRAVDRINVFLRSGDAGDAQSAVDGADGEATYLDGVAWAARFWAGPRWADQFPAVKAAAQSDGIEVPDGLVAVLRYGSVQLSWKVG